MDIARPKFTDDQLAMMKTTYDMLTIVGKEQGWEDGLLEYVDKAHHNLGLLIGMATVDRLYGATDGMGRQGEAGTERGEDD